MDFIAPIVENVEVSTPYVSDLLPSHTVSPHGIYTEGIVSAVEELL